MAKTIQVYKDKTERKRKNLFKWKVVEPSRQKKGLVNVLYMATGYDTAQSAMKQARSHNKKCYSGKLLIEKLD